MKPFLPGHVEPWTLNILGTVGKRALTPAYVSSPSALTPLVVGPRRSPKSRIRTPVSLLMKLVLNPWSYLVSPHQTVDSVARALSVWLKSCHFYDSPGLP